MANFNVSVPQVQDPMYLGYSKAIEQPEGNKTFGTAIKGVGDTIEEGAKAADFLVKSTNKDTIEGEVDSIRDEYTRSLDIMKTAVTGQPTNDPANPSGSLTKVAGGDTPGQLDQGLSAAKVLSDAVSQGKLSPTYYYGRMNALAKNLHSQFPGYRDYIDQEVSKLIGVNPANAYVEHISSDINQQLGVEKQVKEHQLNFLLENSKLDSGVIYQGVRNGTMTLDDGVKRMNEKLANEHQWAADTAKAGATRATDEVTTNESLKTATARANYLASSRIGDVLESAGLNPAKVDDILRKYSNGELTNLDPGQKEQLLQFLVNDKRVAQQVIKKDLIDSGHYVQVGAEKADGVINSSLDLHTHMIDALTNDKTGLALDYYRQSQAITAKREYQLKTDPSMGGYYTTMDIMSKYGPDAQKKYFEYLLNTQPGYGNQEFKNWFGTQLRGFMTQPDLRSKGNANKLLDSLKELKDSNDRAANPIPPSQVAKAVDGLVNAAPTMITDPKVSPQVKQNVLQSHYGPDNAGTFNLIQKDSSALPGRMAAFNKMFDPDVTEAVKKMGPEAMHTYSDRAKSAFASEIFNSEINDLNVVPTVPGLKLSWDTGNHRWNLDANPDTARLRPNSQPYTNTPDMVNARRTVTRLNMGLHNLSKIAEANGEDVDAYLLNTMIGMGFDPTKAPGTIPEAMLRSLIAARGSDLLRKGQPAQ